MSVAAMRLALSDLFVFESEQQGIAVAAAMTSDGGQAGNGKRR